jgi:hypothetical protein
MPAYWVSPKGKILKVDTSHYNYLKDHPKRFDITSQENKDKGTEDIWAYWDLMSKVIKKGWIRVGERGLSGWAFQVADIDGQLGDVADILSRFEAGPQESVIIAGIDDTKPFYRGDVNDVMSGEILNYPQR